MNININHPSFVSFSNQVISNILTSINVDNYFSLTSENKINLQYLVLKLLKSSVKHKAKFSDSELKSLIGIFCKKSEESENYEFASVLNDIFNNFEKINEITAPKKRITKQIKIDKKE